MGQRWTALLVGFLLPGILHAEPKLEQFFAQNCVKCHGPEKQKGKVRLDKPVGALFAEKDLLETIATVLEVGEMPPEKEPQPTAAARAEALQIIQERILAQRPANPLKRLTRAEYTNTIGDLFGVDFDFNGLTAARSRGARLRQVRRSPPHVAASGNGLPQDRTIHRRADVA